MMIPFVNVIFPVMMIDNLIIILHVLRMKTKINNTTNWTIN